MRTCLTSAIAFIMVVNVQLFGAIAWAEEGDTLAGTGMGGPISTKSHVGDACESETMDPLDPKKSEHEKAIKACHDEVTASDTACQPGSNPNAQNAQGQANQQAQQSQQSQSQAAGSGSGQSNNCGGMGDLMKNMIPPMQSYKGDCEGAKTKCESSCPAQAKKSKTACESIIPKDEKTRKQKEACEKNAAKVKSCNEKTAKACSKYSQQIAGIVAALANAALQMMQMQKCQEDQGLDCTTDPTNVQCLKDDTVSCTDPKHFSNPTCICQVNPNAAGCPGADSRKLSDVTQRDPYSKDTSSDTTASPSLSDDGGLDGNKRGASAGAPPSGGGGGAGVGSSGGGAKTASDSTGVAGAKPANPDVLAGDYGGGGGGGRGMGGGYPEVTNSGLGQALKNADARKTASAAGSLTGANGRSNWQKVRERYRDNRPSLMEQGK